ncbi:MAG: AAA family ATPase [Chloroflexi bacterium]|nr:AAA family ATPase [Chloroflexota bacterium]
MSESKSSRGNWLGSKAPTATPPAVETPRPKAKPTNELMERRGRWYNRVFRFVKATWLWALIIGIAIWSYLDADVLNAVLLALQFAFQIVFALFFAIMQFVAIFWFMSRSKTEIILPGDPKSLTLADYKGQKMLVKLVKEWISLLSDRSQFQKMGGNFINGLLLYGPPGTGKTMLAKCMAGEAGIAFMSIEGSGFRAMFWGVDVLKMIQFCGKAKNLAREYGACIAYIDEIDAVGASRGSVMGGGGMGGMMGGMGGGSGSLTRLLYEMDGIGEQSRNEKWQARLYRLIGKKPPIRNWHVLYMGSTNRPDVLDPALTRPGRFDRSLEVSPPDKAGRREIISYYLSKIAHDETVDIEAIVADTDGATPARIMSAITKDAVRIALFAHKNKVAQRDIDLAFQEQYFGIESPIEEMEEDQRKVLAYHEAGHAVAQHYLMPDQRIVRVSIIRRGGAYGYVLPVDTKEWHIVPLRRHILDIMVSMAGRASEIVFFGEPFQSVGGDYANIRQRFWVLYYSGMFGPPVEEPYSMSLDGSRRMSGDKDRVEQYWKNLEAQVEQLLREHANEVHAVVNALLERSDLNSKELVEIVESTRKASNARGEHIPEGLPSMVAQLLPHHQVMTPSGVPALTAPIIAKANGNGHEKVKSKPRARGSSRK